MTLSRSFIRNAVTTPLDARIMNMAGLVANADGSPRAGVLGAAATAIVATTATMNVTIAAAEFATTKGRADGVSIFGNDGSVSVLIGSAPLSNSRIDVIYVKHNDDTTGDANALPVFGVLAGTAAASPSKPGPLPTGALELATIRVYAGTTATNGGSNVLTNTYQMTASRGGVVMFRDQTERDAWTNPVDGQLAHVISLDATFEWVDSTIKWVHVGGKPVASTPFSYQSGYSTETNPAVTPARLVEQCGRIFLEGRMISVSAGFAAGTFYLVATITDNTKWPSKLTSFPANVNDVYGVIRVDVDGTIRFTPSQSFTGPLQLNLASVSWTDKRLY